MCVSHTRSGENVSRRSLCGLNNRLESGSVWVYCMFLFERALWMRLMMDGGEEVNREPKKSSDDRRHASVPVLSGLCNPVNSSKSRSWIEGAGIHPYRTAGEFEILYKDRWVGFQISSAKGFKRVLKLKGQSKTKSQ